VTEFLFSLEEQGANGFPLTYFCFLQKKKKREKKKNGGQKQDKSIIDLYFIYPLFQFSKRL